MKGPISPEDVADVQVRQFPEAAFDAFNAEIAANFCNGSATVKQKDVIARLACAGISRLEVTSNGYLNVEEVYRAAGWSVKYDKPGWSETYEPFFEFRRK